MRTLMLLAVGSLLSAPASAAAQLAEAKISNSDLAFVQTVVHVSQLQAQLGRAAQKNASSAQVREFAGRLAADQERFTRDLLALMTEQGIVVPGVDQKTGIQALIAKKFSGLQDQAYDRQYLRMAMDDLRQMQTLLTGEAKSGEAAYLRSFAARALPTIQQHLKATEPLDQELQEK